MNSWDRNGTSSTFFFFFNVQSQSEYTGDLNEERETKTE
jgi:hypothetical protein